VDVLAVVEPELVATSVEQVEVLTTIASEVVTIDVLSVEAATETITEVVYELGAAAETITLVIITSEVITETTQAVETLEITEAEVITDQQQVVEIITSCAQGPAGPAGVPGPAGGSAFQRVAGETISALRVLYELGGAVFALDYRAADYIDFILGISLTAADPGQPLNVQRSGALEDSGWNWAPGRIWLGANGALTQTPPADGFDVLIGAAVSATRITLNITDPINLE
jgi:hypothetical protein